MKVYVVMWDTEDEGGFGIDSIHATRELADAHAEKMGTDRENSWPWYYVEEWDVQEERNS